MYNIGYSRIANDPRAEKAEIAESISAEAVQHVDSQLNEYGSQTADNLKSAFSQFDGKESQEIDDVHWAMAQAVRNGESKITIDISSMSAFREKMEAWVKEESQEDYVARDLSRYGFEAA